MCGIAGIADLSGARTVPAAALRRMALALVHRGPDDEGYLDAPGLGLACRRLSIVGLPDGHQPVESEDGSVAAVFNGELFDYPDVKRHLQARGHRLVTQCDTELIPHLWEDHQERMFERLRGQFAIAIWDRGHRRLVLARDRFGICPLYWSRQRTADGEWLLFASEVKALLASGLVTASPDLKGIDQAFHFLAVPGPATCFAGVRCLQPGRYLSIDLPGADSPGLVRERTYWAMEFPDQGQEDDRHDRASVVERFDRLMLGAVERRLRADVPVAAYLSGGVDSSLVAAMAARLRGGSLPTFTARITTPRYDESRQAELVGRHIGSTPVIVPVGDDEVLRMYPAVIRAAEAPVIDTAAAATLMLARELHGRGFRVALTGEGSDEWLAGYAWHKVHRLFGALDAVPGIRLSAATRRLAGRLIGVPAPARQRIQQYYERLGHHTAFHDFYSLMTAARYMFFNHDTLERLDDHHPYLELEPDVDRVRRWDPLNQSAYWAARIHLPGHLLSLKGDRVAMQSSVETRYPFLDEDVFAFLSTLHPRWKLRGFRDKYVLRLLGERYLPASIAWRRKAMFRAPLDSFFTRPAPSDAARLVDQLLSDESLRRTGWFRVRDVQLWRERLRRRQVGARRRLIVELGMVGVFAAQLWYHTFIEQSLAELDTTGRAAALAAV